MPKTWKMLKTFTYGAKNTTLLCAYVEKQFGHD